MSRLSLQGISFRYPNGFALQDINLDIAQQSFLALIGPNGSGKTTLLRLITRLLKPEKGHIYLNSEPLERFTPRELARQIAVISSEQYFQFPFPVAEVVAMGRFPFLGRLGTMSLQDHHIVDKALEMTQTERFRERSISQLSSGEKQRVLIARALAQQPSLLLLDEPNTHLDIQHQLAIFDLLRFLNQKHSMTVVVVLHDLTAAAAFSESVALLHQGKLVKKGKPEEVITTETIRSTYGAKVVVHPSPIGNFPQITYAPKTRFS